MSDVTEFEKQDQNILLIFFTTPPYRFYRHLLFIGFISVFLFNGKAMFHEPVLTYTRITALSLVLVLFYTNMYLLVPKLLLRNKYFSYTLSVLSLVTLAGIIYQTGWYFFKPYATSVASTKGNLFTFSVVIFILITASVTIKLFQRWIKDVKRLNDFENLTLQAELTQLKNQINPHFLFNMLNNAHVLTQKDPEKASQVLLGLSDLLRYQLYDSVRTKVLLTADIQFLTDFLDLEKVRRDDFEFSIATEGDLVGIHVPPLLFITFVENAAKHSGESEKKSYINLNFKLSGNELRFHAVNTRPENPTPKSVTGGLGLKNIRRTLALLFPDAHHLEIKDDGELYEVKLILKL